MILSYLYDLSELNNLTKSVVLNIKDYSFSSPKMFDIKSAKEIIDNYDLDVYIDITPLYHESELEGVRNLILPLLHR